MDLKPGLGEPSPIENNLRHDPGNKHRYVNAMRQHADNTDVSHGHGQVLRPYSIRGNLMVSISGCHAEDPCSIPGRGS